MGTRAQLIRASTLADDYKDAESVAEALTAIKMSEETEPNGNENQNQDQAPAQVQDVSVTDKKTEVDNKTQRMTNAAPAAVGMDVDNVDEQIRMDTKHDRDHNRSQNQKRNRLIGFTMLGDSDDESEEEEEDVE